MIWFGLAAAICGEDLFFKSYVRDYIEADKEKEFCNGKMVLTKAYNRGAMMGWLKDEPKKLRAGTLFGVGALVGGLVSVSGKKGCFLQKLGIALMLGGASSNAYERLKYGKVTDYIRFNIGPEEFRKVVFNKGDFAVFGGSLIWLLGECFHK